MRTLPVLLGLLLTFAACDTPATTSSSDITSATPTPAPTPATAINAFAGSWHSSATAGACTSMAWTVTPSSANAATILYSAVCSGFPVSGIAAGTLTDTTMNWTSSGTAGTCTYSLSGTSVAVASSTSTTDLALTYSGTVCGTPVSGTDTLHR